VQQIVSASPDAKVIVTGDMNVDYNTAAHYRQLHPLNKLTPGAKQHGVLHNLAQQIPRERRYTYTYNGRGNMLDWMFASNTLKARLVNVSVLHNKAAQSSDHSPLVARFRLW